MFSQKYKYMPESLEDVCLLGRVINTIPCFYTQMLSSLKPYRTLKDTNTQYYLILMANEGFNLLIQIFPEKYYYTLVRYVC